jgi:hypothetical protein
MLDLNNLIAIGATIATEKDVELLRGVVVTLLGGADQRLQALEQLDPLTVPAFRKETAESIRGQLGQIHNLDAMRVLARDVLKGIQRLDAQIAEARKRTP